jgi:hypothetical protein
MTFKVTPCAASNINPSLSDQAVKMLLPLAPSYLCKIGFSPFVAIKNKWMFLQA